MITLRDARAEDAAILTEMANGLARATGSSDGEMSPESAAALIADPDLHTVIAEHAGSVAGYALYTVSYETAFAAKGLYMSDLFVRAEHRKHGVARALMVELAARAQAAGGRYLWWVVMPGSDAGTFYDRIGAIAVPLVSRAVFDAPFEALLASRDR